MPRRWGRWGPAVALATLAIFGAGAIARAEVVATEDLLVTFVTKIHPLKLPRFKAAPVSIELEAHLKARSGHTAPRLTSVELAIHKAAKLVRRGLPVCEVPSLRAATPADAMAACGGARLGHGMIQTKIEFPEQPSSYVASGVELFNGRLPDGKPAILAHVFTPSLGTSFLVPFTISRETGRYATLLSAGVHITQWAHVTYFRLILRRRFLYRGRLESFLSASCPAPKGFTLGIAPFVRASIQFADGESLDTALVGTCHVRA